MEPAATQAHQQEKIFDRHEAKLLNLALLLYLCFGALLFDSLGDFHDDLHRTKWLDKNKNDSADQSASLDDLRSRSVSRMWNITNQLNILYESNWTTLVRTELIDFERKLIELIERKRDEVAWEGELEIEAPDESGKQTSKGENGRQEAGRTSRSRSIKRSMIHSLATITTMATPQQLVGGRPLGQSAKLATMLYGIIGLPLLFYTVTLTGHRLARSTLNSLILVRHYCYALPVHYLCCACNLYLCFRWLSWCCCCCCCSYLCCCLSDAANKAKCCDRSKAPKLRLAVRPTSRKAKPQHRLQQATSMYSEPSADCGTTGKRSKPSQRRSVRFVNNNQQLTSYHSSDGREEHDADESEFVKWNPQSNTDHNDLYTSGVFATSLTVLSAYILSGAFYYSRVHGESLLDALFVCYEMLSGAKLPPPFLYRRTHKPNGAASDLGEYLKSEANPVLVSAAATGTGSAESMALQTLYLIGGLHLISMCAHYGRLWISGCRARGSSITSDDSDGSDSGDEDAVGSGQLYQQQLCNGLSAQSHSRSPAGSFDQSITPFTGVLQHQQAAAIPAQMDQLHVGASAPSVGPQQVDLAELFVVDPRQQSANTSPLDTIANYSTINRQQQPQQQQQTSDVSFASSERGSTDRGSLCQHHQAQVQAAGAGGSAYGSLYGPSHQMAHRHHHHHHHHLSQNDLLYLQQPATIQSSLMALTVGARSALGGDNNDEDDDEDDEAQVEAERMLDNCISGKHPSSSSTSAQHQNQQFQIANSGSGGVNGFATLTSVGGDNHLNSNTSSSCRSNSATQRANGNQLQMMRQVVAGNLANNGQRQELDSSPNTMDTTNSNTISSISSNRVVNLPKSHLRQQQQMHNGHGVGFIQSGHADRGSDMTK